MSPLFSSLQTVKISDQCMTTYMELLSYNSAEDKDMIYIRPLLHGNKLVNDNM